MSIPEWQEHPDADIEGVFWIRWRGKMTTNKWHATIDGQMTLCHIGIWRRLYVGRQFERCSRCVAAAKRLNEPEGD